MTRLEDWKERLAAETNARRNLPYAYGVNDCWCFARAAVEAMTGVTLMPEVDPPKGWLSAAKVMIARGWADVEDMMTELLGEAMPDPAGAGAGDVVSYEWGGEYHLAVSLGAEAIAPSPGGLQTVPRALWRRAWKVG